MARLGAGSGMVSSGVLVMSLAAAPPEYKGFEPPLRYLPLGSTLGSVAPARIPPSGRIPDAASPAPAWPDDTDPRPHVSGGPADPLVRRYSRATARQQMT